MTAYKTPGVYVKEVSTLPASVAQVATAIPAFVGYTEMAERNSVSLTNTPTRISSLMEYEKLFGGPHPETGITVSITDRSVVANPPVSPSNYIMYYQMQMYFANGGGPCYIVSAGTYQDTMTFAGLQAGLDAVAMEDEPTLIVFPDARGLLHNDFYNLYAAALAQCNALQDRFVIIDLYNDEGNGNDPADVVMRNSLASDYLNYGAAYYPHLQTSLPYHFREDEVVVTTEAGTGIQRYETNANGIEVLYYGDGTPSVVIELLTNTPIGEGNITFNISGEILTIGVPDGDGGPSIGATPTQVRNAWDAWKASNDSGQFEVNRTGNYSVRVEAPEPSGAFTGGSSETNLEALASTDNAAYNAAKAAMAQLTVVVPPSAAMAGAYARTDRDRGVWKAPANITLSNVVAPTVKVTDAAQENLNVDTTAGKSINAIRAFFGKGTLVWGARTLDGNDNEWRYIPTRRLFIMAEESIRKATSWVVFEPNDARTWVKVKAQIENFLSGLWRDGALAGATAGEAFYVNVGMGVTMDAQDILEGRLNIEIGMAAVRPAEFVILKFSHKLQES